MAELLLKLCLLCFLPAILLHALAIRYFADRYSHSLLSVFSLGLAPAICTLTQYYLLILFPHFGPAFYVLVPLLGLIMAAWPLRKNWVHAATSLMAVFPDWFNNNKVNVFLILSLLFYWLAFVLENPIAEHDFFEYAIQGKIFAEEQIIRFEKNRFHASSGFYYVGLHGYLFPLEATKEQFFNMLIHLRSDFYFRSLTGYYWILIVFFQYHLFASFSRRSALVANAILVFTYGFYLTFITYHIDSFRILLLMFALFWAWYFVKVPNKKHLWVTAAIMGLTAFSHSLGMFLMCLLMGLIFIFLKGNFGSKLNLTISLLLGFLPFGALHYLLDVFYGTGWLFKEIKFF